MNLIFLIGMPGAGKTYWGTQMATALNLPFIDLDKYIEEQEEESISYIFQQYGEHIFREKEILALQNLIDRNKQPAIIACGGGTPAFEDNLDMMKKAGCVLYLKASIETLLTNLQYEAEQRPLLKDGEAEALLKSILEKRAEYYKQAHYILDVENLSVATFAQIIARCSDRPF